MSVLAAFAVPHPPLLIPEVGSDSRFLAQKTEEAIREVALRSVALDPETVVFFSPHATCYADYFHVSPGALAAGDFGGFGTLGAEASYVVEYDQEFVAALEIVLAERGIPGGTAGEREPALDHGTMVPLHFINEAMAQNSAQADSQRVAEAEAGAGVAQERKEPGRLSKTMKVVRVGLSGLGRALHKDLGKAVAEVARKLKRRTVVIASGDLSHKLQEEGPYGYAPEGPVFDDFICTTLSDGNMTDLLSVDEQLCEAAAECGLHSFIVMSGVLEGSEYSSELLSYEGPFGVGYAVASYIVTSPLHRGESLPVALARRTIRCWLETGGHRPSIKEPGIQELLEAYQHTPEGQQLYGELSHTCAGAFVSLHKQGALCGCIGTIAPTQSSVLAEIINNAVSAASDDPRFPPIKKGELEQLEIEVDILGEAEPVEDRDTLNAERYGVIVSSDWRRGLLLPALSGVDTPDEQIAIALAKAGIREKEPYDLERFEVVRYS